MPRAPHMHPVEPPLAARPFDAHDPRALALVQGKIPAGAAARPPVLPVHLIGVPYDDTVPGRKGAAKGPEGVREAFRYYSTYDMDQDVDIAGLAVVDHGDLDVAGTPEEVHERLAQATAWSLRSGALPFIFGGDNSISYGALRGVAAERDGRIGIIVVDAHYDVREVQQDQITSGTPYRRILTELEGLPGTVTGADLIQIGIRPLANSRHHAEAAKRLGIESHTAAEVQEQGIRKLTSGILARLSAVDHLWLSIDMDGVDPAHAPGVSAPIPGGLTSADLLHLVGRASRHPGFCGIDITETAPPLDPTGNTARLAALTLLTAMVGHVARAS